MVMFSLKNLLSKSFFISSLILFILTAPTKSSCQQTSWLSSNFSLDNYVTTLYNDKSTNSLFIGGVFQHIDNIKCNSILRLDSSGLSFLDTMNFVATPPHVILRYDTAIYVGGFYGLHRLINGKWDSVAFNSGFKVNDLVLEDGSLIVGGYFVNIGNQTNFSLARYDGITFTDYHNFSNEVQNSGEVGALIKFNHELIVGGNFEMAPTKEILSWNDSNWFHFNGGIQGIGDEWVSALEEYNGDLYVAGRFKKEWGSPGDNILKWSNGKWSEVGLGIKGVQVDALKVYQGKLWAAGKFTNAGLVSCSNIAFWDGNQWCAPTGEFNQGISAMEVYNDTLYVGGGFDMIDGDATKRYLIKFNADSPMRCDSTVGISTPNEIKGFLIYPNPSFGRFTIEFKSKVDGIIQIFDLLGKEVFSSKIKGKSNVSFDFDKEISNGIYFIHIVTSNGSTTQQLLVIK